MAVSRKATGQAEDYVQEIKAIVRQRFPDAEFNVHRLKRDEYRVEVIADVEDAFDILDLTSERSTDILVDTGIWIVVTPIRRAELVD